LWSFKFFIVNILDHADENLSIFPVPRSRKLVMLLAESVEGNKALVNNWIFSAFLKVIKSKISVYI
jgi:hypothetical protein